MTYPFPKQQGYDPGVYHGEGYQQSYGSGYYSHQGYYQDTSYSNQYQSVYYGNSSEYENYRAYSSASSNHSYSSQTMETLQITQPPTPQPNQKRKVKEKEKESNSVPPKECFPVSSGTHHKQTAEGYVPKRQPIPPHVISKLALAKSKIESSPYDPEAQAQLNAAMMEYHNYMKEKDSAYESDVDAARRKTGYEGPGLFTGESLVEPMSKEEIDSDDIRTFTKPDMFSNLKPLEENLGKSIMKKYGWTEGSPLGTTGCGTIAPIELTIKIDRKGLSNETEYVQRKPDGLAKNEGPAWICKVINGKNPICGIGELHQAMGIPTPIFKLVSDVVCDFQWKVHTNWGTFAPQTTSRSKKQAKSECAYHALKEILRLESEQLGLEPPTEASTSSFLCVVFIPSNKTLRGNKMLYKHFYKSGTLTNVSNLHSDSAHESLEQSVSILSTSHLKWSKPSVPMHHILQTGANWMIKYVNGKNASHGLLDLCLSQNKFRPEEYSQYINGSHIVTINTHWGSFTHSEGHKSRKDARLHVAYQAVKEIMAKEAAKFNTKPPVETPESSRNYMYFNPDTS